VADPFVGEIRMFGGNFAPRGWAFCNGQLLPLAQNTTLFSLLGTMYGGDGATSFALPDLRGRAPMHRGAGPGLTDRLQGASIGQAAVGLSPAQIPAHNHGPLRVHAGPATSGTPSSAKSLAASSSNIYGAASNLVAMGDSVGGTPHENRQPYQAVSFIIALQGIWPQRS
jgi:microcystin-dependent protein